MLVGTMLATWIGTGSVLGNAGKTYETGLAAIMLPAGSILGIILLVAISSRVRRLEKLTHPRIESGRTRMFWTMTGSSVAPRIGMPICVVVRSRLPDIRTMKAAEVGAPPTPGAIMATAPPPLRKCSRRA